MIYSKIKENCISSENKCNLLVSQVDYEYNKRMSNIFETHMLYSLSFFLRYKCLSFSMVSEVWPTVCFLDLSCTDCSHC